MPALTSFQAQEHPLDVLSFFMAQESAGKRCALAMLTATEGGSVRAPGALMAVTEDGQSCGYLSGGCIDADVRLHARSCLKTGRGQTFRYGKGSPFLDIALPCGGAIEVSIFPLPDKAIISAAIDALTNRRPTSFAPFDGPDALIAYYRPKLRLRIAGRSADPLALARISVAAGIETALWSPDPACLANAKTIEGLTTVPLTSPTALPQITDDGATAFVLMMHDQDWESALLAPALAGNAFYVGAVGSPHTHVKRRAHLANQGLPASEIDRIHAPIGLVPSLRDASMLAISTLAEIIGTFHTAPTEHIANQKAFENV